MSPPKRGCDHEHHREIDIDDSAFEAAFARLLVSPAEADVGLAGTVSGIVAAVAQEGDAALLRLTNELDQGLW